MSMHVLLVEDDEFMVEALQDFLVECSYRVSIANNGNAALTVAQAGSFDVALSDINMPKMDGFTLCEMLRRRYAMPVVLMTGYGIEEMEQRASAVGAHAVLRKPFSLDALQSALNGATRMGAG